MDSYNYYDIGYCKMYNGPTIFDPVDVYEDDPASGPPRNTWLVDDPPLPEEPFQG